MSNFKIWNFHRIKAFGVWKRKKNKIIRWSHRMHASIHNLQVRLVFLILMIGFDLNLNYLRECVFVWKYYDEELLLSPLEGSICSVGQVICALLLEGINPQSCSRNIKFINDHNCQLITILPNYWTTTFWTRKLSFLVSSIWRSFFRWSFALRLSNSHYYCVSPSERSRIRKWFSTCISFPLGS